MRVASWPLGGLVGLSQLIILFVSGGERTLLYFGDEIVLLFLQMDVQVRMDFWSFRNSSVV